MNKASTSTIVLYSIQAFGTISFILLSSIFLYYSGEISAIFIGLAYIIYSVCQAIRLRKGRTIDKGSLSIAFFGVIALVLGIITSAFTIISEDFDAIVRLIMMCISGVLILIIVICHSLIIIIRHFSISKKAKRLVNLAYALIPLLIILGAASTIFLQLFFDFKLYMFSVVGCLIWYAVTIYIPIYFPIVTICSGNIILTAYSIDGAQIKEDKIEVFS